MVLEKESPSQFALTFREYGRRKRGEEQSHEAVIFFPGWAMRGDSWALFPLGQAMKRAYPESRVFTISTRPLHSNASHEDEMQRISEFLQRRNISKVTLVGYSEGARRALFAARTLPENIHVEQTVLAAPLGLTQTPHLTGRLLRAMAFDIPFETLRSIRSPKDGLSLFYGFLAAAGIVNGTVQEVGNLNPIRYLRRLHAEVKEMSQGNQNAPSARIVLGRRDTVVRLSEVGSALPTDMKPIIIERFSSHGMPLVHPNGFVDRVFPKNH